MGAVAASAAAPAPAPALLLVTLDTTRADHLGAYGSGAARTPTLDGLARRGARWERALTASPLTLPAHCSILTGLQPPEHGVRDNGSAALPADLPTLATALSERGYDTAAVVASRVLDRRFGLDRGFATYDDRMAAEAIGQYGYPERDARAVTDAALGWWTARAADPSRAARPWFLWVHYYDPHAPYAPPGATTDESDADRYAAEIAYVDEELGRLLAALPAPGSDLLIAVVGDHGESLGEHGETGHGLFLYEPSLRVPLFIVGPRVEPGTAVPGTVATSHLAATLLHLLGQPEAALPFGTPLPGISWAVAGHDSTVTSETLLPATAYGWSALQAMSDDRWRLIIAPRPELYDLATDPGESENRIDDESAVAARLRNDFTRFRATTKVRQAEAAGAVDLAGDLRALGYLSGTSGAEAEVRFGEGIDPKDGIAWLADFERAKGLLADGRSDEARKTLEALVAVNPENVPFRAQLANALLATGDGAGAIRELEAALARNPRLDFLHAALARAQLAVGDLQAARLAGERAVAINPRLAGAWLTLGEIAARSGTPGEERRLLLQAVQADTDSAAILTRLGQVAIAGGELQEADERLGSALRLAPDLAMAWLLWGDVAERQGLAAPALERYLRAVELDPREAVAALRAARLLAARGDLERARQLLVQAAAVAPESSAGQEARRRLAVLDGTP